MDTECPAYVCGADHASDYLADGHSIRDLPVGVTASVRMTVTLPGSASRRSGKTNRPSRAASAVTDEQLVADIDVADAALLGCADVIVQRDDISSSVLSRPYARFAEIFARHPGCAVAAIATAAGDHLVGLPGSSAIRFVRQRGRSDRHTGDELGTSAVAVCASLVHVWMASGRRVGALDGVTIGVHVAGGLDCSGFTCRVDHVP